MADTEPFLPRAAEANRESKYVELFPGRMHLLRQLDAEGYVDAYITNTSPDLRIYHRTEKGEAAVRLEN